MFMMILTNYTLNISLRILTFNKITALYFEGYCENITGWEFFPDPSNLLYILNRRNANSSYFPPTNP